MIDFSGKIPDGVYRDVFKTPLLPNVYVPQGNHFVPGSWQSCLNLHAKINSTLPLGLGPKTIDGRWSMMALGSQVKGKNTTSVSFEQQLQGLSNYQGMLKKILSQNTDEESLDSAKFQDVSKIKFYPMGFS